MARWTSITCAALATLTVGWNGSAAAEAGDDGSIDLDGRWIPSISLFSFGQVEQRTAEMSSDVRVDLNAGGQPLDRDGQTNGISWSIGGTVDLASPVLIDVPGKPRFFTHADVGFNYDLEDPVATRGDPGDQVVLPPGRNVLRGFDNVGASVRAEGKPLLLAGGLGTQLSFVAFDRGIRVRPTLEWMYRRDTIKNTLGTAEVEGPGTTTCTPTCRVLYIRTQNEKGFHSLGPGLEVEADVGRKGEFLVGLYTSFRAYYVVSDRKANIRSTGSWTRLDGQPTTRADTDFLTRYEREPWHYRFGAGVRILWSPEE